MQFLIKKIILKKLISILIKNLVKNRNKENKIIEDISWLIYIKNIYMIFNHGSHDFTFISFNFSYHLPI